MLDFKFHKDVPNDFKGQFLFRFYTLGFQLEKLKCLVVNTSGIINLF